jgi:hypothetical protein
MVSITDTDIGTECTSTQVADPCSTKGGCGCGTHNVRIRRNHFWSKMAESGLDYPYDNMATAILLSAHNVIAEQDGGELNAIIENNTIRGQRHRYSCEVTSDPFRAQEAALSVLTEDAVTIRNNTLYDNECGLVARSGFAFDNGGNGAVAHTIINNLSVKASGLVEIYVGPSASGSTFTNNAAHPGAGGSGNIATIGSTNYSCSTFPSVGTANICPSVPVAFTSVTDPDRTRDTDPFGTPGHNLVDLHLSGNQACVNAGTAGPDDDIDQEIRACFGGTTDIGADEILCGYSDVVFPSDLFPPPSELRSNP